MDSRIYEYLNDGVTFITPTQRLGRHLRYRFAAYQFARGKAVWQTPDCLPWSAWRRRAFECLSLRSDDDFILLDHSQQSYVWQDIINCSEYRDRFLQAAATVRQAVFAYRLCKEWGVPVFPEEVYLSEDSRAFKSWYKTYELRREKDRLLDEDCLADTLSEAVVAQNIRFGKLAFYGFDMLTTQQQRLIDALRQAGNEIIDIDPSTDRATVAVSKQHDDYSECLAAACWAKKWLQAHPSETIGVVSPSLGAIRNDVERAFRSVFEADHLLHFTENRQKLYSVSLGCPLTDFPLVHTALGLLSLGEGRISLNTLSRLLHSSFIEEADAERPRRANFDALLKNVGERRPGIRLLYELHERRCRPHEQCQSFIGLLKKSASLIKGAKAQSLGRWTAIFSEYLSSWGWPGERPLNSDEYQQLLAWQQVLGQLGGLDQVGKPVDFSKALFHLRQLLADTHFQPETGETPIQILGMAAAAAMRFDRLWILGMRDDNWPMPASVNAFIPLACQRQYHIPSADAASQLRQAQIITDNLLSSAGEVVLSYAQWDSDRECRPSSLIRPYLDYPLPDYIEGYQDYKKIVFASAELEYFIDNAASALSAGAQVDGGSTLFKDQAACPFRAFARHRLYARGLPQADIGPDAMMRGKLAHRALQFLWQVMQSSAGLHEQSPTALKQLIRDAATSATRQQAWQRPETFGKRFTELEQERLEQLLWDWLAFERERQEFKVLSREKKETVKFADMELNLRIDRVDELAGGRCVIIDYKTGKVGKNDWDSDRPNEPQLPFYAVTSKRPVAAIVFASLKRGALGFIGRAAEDGILPDVQADESWQGRLDDWEQVLLKLGHDYRAGMAPVDPIRTACNYCDLHALCRIYERVDGLAGSGKEDMND